MRQMMEQVEEKAIKEATPVLVVLVVATAVLNTQKLQIHIEPSC